MDGIVVESSGAGKQSIFIPEPDVPGVIQDMIWAFGNFPPRVTDNTKPKDQEA
jgi:hypothetical protein